MFQFRTSLAILGIIAGIILGFAISKAFPARNKELPIVLRINEVRKMNHLRLVTYHFEEIIPIEKNDKIKLLLVVPAVVSGYINLDDLYYEVKNDTLLTITLPEPNIDSATFQLENAVNYDLEMRFNINLGSGLYQQVFSDLKTKLRESKASITQKSIEMGIYSETEDAAKEYLGILFSDLSYNISFKSKENIILQ